MTETSTVTILFTDVEGSTALTQKLGDARAQQVLVNTHNEIVRENLRRHGGSEIKHTGDGIMASFHSATHALESAIEIQQAFARHNEEAEEPMRVRIGLNAGEPIAEQDDLFGSAVQLAARICAKAEPGEILVSSVVHELAAGKGYAFSKEREMRLKGFAERMRVCNVRWREEEDSPAILQRTRRHPMRAAIAAGAAVVCLGIAILWDSQRPEMVETSEPSGTDQRISFCNTSDGVRIAYATSGEGHPALVRVLGWFTHLEFEWEHPLLRPFHDVGGGRLLVRYDGRGMGLSDRKVDDFSVEARVRDLEAVVDDLELERFALYGVSEGGPVALIYAVRHPERVSHLIFYGSYAKQEAQPEDAGNEDLDTLLALVRQGWGSDVPAHRQFFTGLFMPDADGEAIRVFSELQRVSAPAENVVAIMSANVDTDVRHLLNQVAAPTLVIHRRNDSAAPFEWGRALAAGIPGARFLPLEGRNHAIPPDDPALQIRNSAIEQFLSEDLSISPPQPPNPPNPGAPHEQTHAD